MRAVVVERWLEPHELRVSDVGEPEVRPGTLAIEVRAAGCNFFDILMVKGEYQGRPAFPFVPGAEGAGVGTKVGEGGEGCAAGDRTMHSNGVLFTVYDPSLFTEDDAYQEELENLIRHVHTSRVDPAIGEILLPGEPEFRSARQRQRNGIAVDDTTWARIVDAARGLGLNPDPWEDDALH